MVWANQPLLILVHSPPRHTDFSAKQDALPATSPPADGLPPVSAFLARARRAQSWYVPASGLLTPGIVPGAHLFHP